VFEEERQGTVAAHAVASDAYTLWIKLWEVCKERDVELSNVALHFVVFAPRCFRSVDIEAGSTAEVIGIVFAFNIQPAWCS